MTTYPSWGKHGMPGISSERNNSERAPLFQTFFLGDAIISPHSVIDSAAVDVGNSGNTSVLRPGLVMARLDADGNWTDYDPDATDGSQIAKGILMMEVNLLRRDTGAAADQYVNAVCIGGKIKEDELIGLDYQARKQLTDLGAFSFIDKWHNLWSPVSKDDDYTVVAADNGTEFNTIGATGAVNFTLPTIAVGLEFAFRNTVDQNMTVTSAAGNDIITFNDLAASSIAFSTSSEKIGAYIKVQAKYIGANLRWVVEIPCSNTATVA